ncbi:YqaJ viral recombinase family protein [Microbacterium sp. 22242]|uniref:YqaJ viral recombinase family protein n=1 Tax=Microbacterium sp. 22242 TaxID=3453896 RepID=UPI003F82E8BA
MIAAERFIARDTERDKWLAARKNGVTATEVRDAATDAGFRNLVASWSDPQFEGNEYTAFGNWAEPDMLNHAHQTNGILPSGWLIASEGDPRWLATPDGLSLDHSTIAEAKTTSKDWGRPPLKYMRQIQWQLFVTGAEKCLLLWHLRATADDGSFYLPWIEPKTLWIERDETMIATLIGVAENVWEAKRG